MEPDKNAVATPRLSLLPTSAVWLAITVGLFWILYIGRAFLIPLVLAILLTYFIEVLTGQWRRLKFGGHVMPGSLARMLAIFVMLLGIYLVAGVVTDNATLVAEAAPRYHQRLIKLYEDVLAGFGLEGPDAVEQLMNTVNLGSLLAGVASGLTALLGNVSLILIYIVFLLLERPFLAGKLAALVQEEDQRKYVVELLARIDHDVRIYLGVKSSVSLLTAVVSYVIMRSVGLDFPEFFALLIFIFNFIPNIGSVIATILPTTLALLQFDSLKPFLIVGIGVTSVQLLVGNFLEPPLMGKSLNISPLVVILSLVFWGMIWGIAGMFLCVPISVIAMIIFSRFENTRWIAVLLSKDGSVKGG